MIKTNNLLVLRIFFIFSLFSILTFSNVSAWYDSAWFNRKPIITNNLNHTNEAYEINVTGLSLAQNDCKELRITTLNDTEINYQVINGTGYDFGGTVNTGAGLSQGSQWCYITFIGQPNTNYYVYYNNTNISSIKTYPLIRQYFDDFNSYTNQLPAGMVCSKAYVKANGGYLNIHGIPVSDNPDCEINTTQNHSDTTAIIRWVNGSFGQNTLIRYREDPGLISGYRMQNDGGTIKIYSERTSSFVGTTCSAGSVPAVWSFSAIGNSTFVNLTTWVDGSLCGYANETTNIKIGDKTMSLSSGNSGVDIDWAYIYNGTVSYYPTKSTVNLGTEQSIEPWSNTSYKYRKRVVLSNLTDSTAMTNPIYLINENRYGSVSEYDGVNVTGLSYTNNLLNEIMVYGLNNQTFDFQILDYGSNWAVIQPMINRSASTDVIFWVYYNCPTCSVLSSRYKNITLFADEFNGTSANTLWRLDGTGSIQDFNNGKANFTYTTGGTNLQWAVANLQKQFSPTYNFVVKSKYYGTNCNTGIIATINTGQVSTDGSGSPTDGFTRIAKFYNSSSGKCEIVNENPTGQYIPLSTPANENYHRYVVKWYGTTYEQYVDGVLKGTRTFTSNSTRNVSLSVVRNSPEKYEELDYLRVYANSTNLGYQVNFYETTFTPILDSEEQLPTEIGRAHV